MQKQYSGSGFWAVILGGSSGMGLASARQLAKSGMNLCLVFRERRTQVRELEPVLEEMRDEGIKVMAFNQDAGKPEVMESIIAELRQAMETGESVRLLLHSIAKGNLKTMVGEDSNNVLSTQDFELTIDAMALNWYRWTRALIDAELFASDARLLAFTSEGSRRAWKGYGAVATAKAALEALARNMALEFASVGMRCNILQPGITDTPSMRMIPGSDEMIESATKRNPFQRLTTPEDVARVVELMCREESAWINGAIIPVDGGESISS